MAVSYTVQRNGIYYFNFRIPSCDTVFRKSLKTDSAMICKQLVKVIIGEVKQRMQLNKEVTKEFLNDIIETILSNEVRHIAYHSDAVLKPDSRPKKEMFRVYTAHTKDVREYNYNMSQWGGDTVHIPEFSEWVVKRITEHGYSKSRYDQIMLNNKNRIFKVTEDMGSECDGILGDFAHQLRQVTEIAKQLGEFIKSNDFLAAKQQSEQLKTMYGHMLPDHLKEPTQLSQSVNASNPVDQTPVSTAPTFNTVLEDWQKEWELTDRMLKERTKWYKLFTHYLGEIHV